MSRLLHPGLGDYCDRWVILGLKIADADRRGVDASHFRQERLEIAIRIRETDDEVALREALRDLKQVNGELWQLQDELAAFVSALPPRHTSVYKVYIDDVLAAIGQIAIETYQLNEQRAQIVQTLNGGDLEKIR